METLSQPKKYSVIGILFTIAVSAGFVWTAAQWLQRDILEPRFSAGQRQENERLTFANLQLISEAQNKYKQTDWNGDGKKTYAAFFVHLWTTIDAAGTPVCIELIPQNLGFAMEPVKEVNGYYFIDIHERVSAPFDYEKEWAIFGIPSSHGQTGAINFFVNNDGIYVNPAQYIPVEYPGSLSSDEWTKIETLGELTNFQNKMHTTAAD